MAESFGGTLNLTLWILLLIGSVYYSFRCLFQTKQFNDQYGFGDGAVFMTRFAGTNVGAAAVISLALLVYGPAGAWAFVAWGWVPGGDREPAPGTYEDHLMDVAMWGAAGQPCPEIAER